MQKVHNKWRLKPFYVNFFPHDVIDAIFEQHKCLFCPLQCIKVVRNFVSDLENFSVPALANALQDFIVRN